ncbi:MAG TPA: rod shape-determining protein MreC [Candidatus Paceibacterota bacterium]|nr:rod shape-determining protein MreC [Candidatus Paceibacterota bacterium]
MRRIFSARRNALLTPTGLSAGALALAFVLAVLALRLLAPNLFWKLMAPAMDASNAVANGTHALLAGFENSATLAAQNDALSAENTALAYKNQALLEENANLTALLGTAPAPKKGILAGVLARPPESPYDTLVVAAGADAGVTRGMEAFGAGGVPLGVVTTVHTDVARVTLFSAPDMITGGWAGSTSVPITIRGAGAGALDASIQRSAGIAAGDTVFVPGPGMLPIGIVARIDGDPSAPTVTLRIQPMTNVFSLVWVTLRDSGTDLLGALQAATSTLP